MKLPIDLEHLKAYRKHIAIGGTVLVIVLFAACGGCGRKSGAPGADAPTNSAASSSIMPASVRDGGITRDPKLWTYAKSEEVEDLTALAAHEGAAGLVEAASDADLRNRAIRAMAFARGWAQMPFLARAASGKNDEEANLALDAILELAARPRRSEESEDETELKEACESLNTLARDAKTARPRRVGSIRALRMLPCPPSKTDLPKDVDSK